MANLNEMYGWISRMEERERKKRLFDALKRKNRVEMKEILKEIPKDQWPTAQIIPFVIQDFLLKKKADENAEYLLLSFAFLVKEHKWSLEKRKKIDRILFYLYVLHTRTLFKKDSVTQKEILDMFNELVSEYPPSTKIVNLINRRSLSSVRCTQRKKSYREWLDQYASLKEESFYDEATTVIKDMIYILYREESPDLIDL